MMIWLPYESFVQSASAMDSKTLTVQRFDAFRLLKAIQQGTGSNNPCVQMWRDSPMWLAAYGMAVCREWEIQADRASDLTNVFQDYIGSVIDITERYPRWLGDSLVHLSHRSNMIRLNPEHYSRQWPGVVEGMPLAWPVEGDEDE